MSSMYAEAMKEGKKKRGQVCYAEKLKARERQIRHHPVAIYQIAYIY